MQYKQHDYEAVTKPEAEPDEQAMFKLCAEGLKAAIPRFMSHAEARQRLTEWFPAQTVSLELV